MKPSLQIVAPLQPPWRIYSPTLHLTIIIILQLWYIDKILDSSMQGSNKNLILNILDLLVHKNFLEHNSAYNMYSIQN